MPTSRRRTTLIALCLLNVLAAIASYAALSATVAAGKTILVSSYRELDIDGVINREALREYDDGRYARAWTDVPDDLGRHSFRLVENLSYLISAAFLVNAAVLGAFASKATSQESPKAHANN